MWVIPTALCSTFIIICWLQMSGNDLMLLNGWQKRCLSYRKPVPPVSRVCFGKHGLTRTNTGGLDKLILPVLLSFNICFSVNLDQLVPPYSFSTWSGRAHLGISGKGFHCPDVISASHHQCKSTKGNINPNQPYRLQQVQASSLTFRIRHVYCHTKTVLQPFFPDYSGESVPEG